MVRIRVKVRIRDTGKGRARVRVRVRGAPWWCAAPRRREEDRDAELSKAADSWLKPSSSDSLLTRRRRTDEEPGRCSPCSPCTPGSPCSYRRHLNSSALRRLLLALPSRPAPSYGQSPSACPSPRPPWPSFQPTASLLSLSWDVNSCGLKRYLVL